MKKDGLLELLNKSADSINLHDASLCGFKWINGAAELMIVLGEYHYAINELEKYVDDVKDRVILILQFKGIKDVECAFYGDFIYENAEIMGNNQLDDGVFEFEFLERTNPGRMSFKYDQFAWDVIGEFNDEQLEEWYKSSGTDES
jgi:hypothetical protein